MEKMKLKIIEADNGIVFVDKNVLSVDVIAYGTDNDRSEIYRRIGEAVYEEWLSHKCEGECHGVVINVEFNPITKDILY